MKVRTEIALPIALLLSILAVVTLGAVALLWRMAPAIEQIRGENLDSMAAVQQMLEGVVVSATQPEEARARFRAGLELAERNVTEEAERPLLDAAKAASGAALSGDAQAQANLLATLRSLSEVNHDSVERADDEAKRMGTAGAWAAVLLGLVGALFSAVAVFRLSRSVVRPTQKLHDVARSHQSGDPYRRVGRLHGAEEFEAVGRSLDELLDQSGAGPARAPEAPKDAPALRKALLHFLEEEPGPMVLIDESAHVIAANKTAMEGGAASQELPRPGLGTSPPDGAIALSANLWLVRVPPAVAP